MNAPIHTTDNPPDSAPVDAIAHWRDFAPDLANQVVLWSEVIPGGGHWSWRVKRGTRLRFVALGDAANVSLVLYNAHNTLERYNMPDSLKAQHTAHFTHGHVLMSDMGRAMASIVADSLGWHDPLGMLLDSATMQAKYGEHRFGPHRNAMHRSGRDNLLIEIGKYGLEARDLIAPVNLFSKIQVDDAGRFSHRPQACQQHSVELRADMDVMVAVSTSPHPLDSRSHYAPSAVGLVAWQGAPATADDYCRHFRPECARALHNADVYAAAY